MSGDRWGFVVSVNVAASEIVYNRINARICLTEGDVVENGTQVHIRM